MAAVLAHGDEAVLSHRSAAVLWRLTGSEGRRVDVTSDRGRCGRPGVALHRCQRAPEDLTVEGGIPVTTATRTLFDLAESIPFPALRRACDEADRQRLLEMKELERIVERGWGRRALKQMRPLLIESHHVEIVRSPLEELFASFCHQHDLPLPSTNVTVLDREVDALWPRERLIVELDGFSHHRHRTAFETDRTRDAAFLIAGYRVIRLTHRRLTREADTIATEIRTLLARL